MNITHGIVASLFAALPALADPIVGDPVNGKIFAQEVCADCHNIGRMPTLLSTDKPRTFLSVANDPKYTDTALRVFLRTPHSAMPDFIMTRSQTDDIIAYIASMRKNN